MNQKERVICKFKLILIKSFSFELQSKNDDLISTYTRSENGYGFTCQTLGLKMGKENNMF